jgi:hypothetical protein
MKTEKIYLLLHRSKNGNEYLVTVTESDLSGYYVTGKDITENKGYMKMLNVDNIQVGQLFKIIEQVDPGRLTNTTEELTQSQMDEIYDNVNFYPLISYRARHFKKSGIIFDEEHVSKLVTKFRRNFKLKELI